MHTPKNNYLGCHGNCKTRPRDEPPRCKLLAGFCGNAVDHGMRPMSGSCHTAVIAEMLVNNEPLISQVTPAMSAVFIASGRTLDNGYERQIHWLVIEPSGALHGYSGAIPNHANDTKKLELMTAASFSLAELLNTSPPKHVLENHGYFQMPQSAVTQNLLPALSPLRQMSMRLVMQLPLMERRLLPFHLFRLIGGRHSV
jgi:hypothetical protein